MTGPLLDRFEPAQFSTVTLKPFPAQIMVVMLILATGMFLNMANSIPAIFLAGIAVTLFSIKRGVAVEINGKRYRDFTSILWMTFGKWKQLGDYDFVLLTKKSDRRYAAVSIGFGVAHGGHINEMNLVTKGDRDVLLMQTSDYDAIVEQAKLIANHFHIKVSERIDGEYFWIYDPAHIDSAPSK